MTSEAIVLWTETSSDPELIAGVRAGDSAAFGVLYERHVGAARKVAAQYTNTAVDIDDVVSESFSRVLRALQRGDGPDLAFRAYLFTIVRRTGLDIINKAIRTKPRDDMSPYESSIGYEASSDEPTMDGFEHGLVADAFKSLPERWQAVLWYTEVEKKNPKEIAPLLGLSANGVAALAYRAREALRQAYLQQHLNSSEEVDCLEANSQLGAYVRGGLSKREHAKVDWHVQVCERCTALVAELADVNRGMRGIIAPLFMGVLGVGALEGGLPIGGAFAPHGAGAGGTGAGSAGGASGTAGANSVGVVGATGAAGATGVATSTVGGVAGFFGAVSHIALPAAAVIGATALALNGASILGWLSPGVDRDAADGPHVAATPDPSATAGEEGNTTNPDREPAPAPENDIDNTADAPAEDAADVDGDSSGGGQPDGGGQPAAGGQPGLGGTGAGSGGPGGGGVDDSPGTGGAPSDSNTGIPTGYTDGGNTGGSSGADSDGSDGGAGNPDGNAGSAGGTGSTGGTGGTGGDNDGAEDSSSGSGTGTPGGPGDSGAPGGPGDSGAGGGPGDSGAGGGSDDGGSTGDPDGSDGAGGNDETDGNGSSPGDSPGPGDNNGDGGQDGEPGDSTDPDDSEDAPVPTPPAPAAFSISESALNDLVVSRDDPEIAMTVKNTGESAAEDITAQITLPDGLQIAPPGSGGGGAVLVSAERIETYIGFSMDGIFDAEPWDCVANQSASVASCTLESLAPGKSTTLTVKLDENLPDELADDAVTEFKVTAGDVTESYTVNTALAEGDSKPLDPIYVGTGGEAVAHFGGTVMGCDPDPKPWTACYRAMTDTTTGSGSNLSNNDWNMVEINRDGGIRNSGVTSVNLPDDATVKTAFLEWSANRYVHPTNPSLVDPWTASIENATARVKLDSGDFVTIEATEINDEVVEENREYYLARADVTHLLEGLTATELTVADIAVAETRREQAVHTYYGGFTLTVVYKDPDIHEDTRVALFEGPHWVKGSSPVNIDFRAFEGQTVTPSWTVYEGDRGNTGDRLRLGGHTFTPLAVYPDGTTRSRAPDDAADSWANGSPWTNTLGIDANSFAGKEISADGRYSVTASTDGDNYMIGTLAVTITPADTGVEPDEADEPDQGNDDDEDCQQAHQNCGNGKGPGK